MSDRDPVMPRNWDITGWCVDCAPGPAAFVRSRCASVGCTFHAVAASDEAVNASMWEHHRAIHLPNADYSAHTQRAAAT